MKAVFVSTMAKATELLFDIASAQVVPSGILILSVLFLILEHIKPYT